LVFSLSQKANSLFGFGQIFLAVVLVGFLFGSLWFWFSSFRVFKFSFVFSIFVFAVGQSFG